MFFDNPEHIPKIATRSGCSIFTVDSSAAKQFSPAHSTLISPLKDRSTISIKQIRDLIDATQRKRHNNHFFIITPADAMTEAAANALLKTIEQPPKHCHFVLLTKTPSMLLPTILSRSQLYYLRKTIDFYATPKVSAQIQTIAKKLLTASPQQLPNLATTIATHKPNNRQFALQITETAIEMLFKAFCQTHQPKWLAKIPKFITLHENLSKNGHVKLHLVADLC